MSEKDINIDEIEEIETGDAPQFFEEQDAVPVESLDNEKLSSYIQEAFEIRREIDEYNNIISDLKKSLADKEFIIGTAMDELGLEKVSTGSGTVTRKPEILPQIIDFDKFMDFIAKEHRYELIQKRIGSTAFKAYFAEKGEYPEGLEGYPSMKLNFRKK